MRRLTQLKLTILEKGLTQKEVSEKSGIDPSIISLIATGKYNPDSEQRLKIARAMQTHEKELFPDISEFRKS